MYDYKLEKEESEQQVWVVSLIVVGFMSRTWSHTGTRDFV